VRDTDLWRGGGWAGWRLRCLPLPLVASRQHPGQTSVLLRDRHCQEKELFYAKAVKTLAPRMPDLGHDLATILTGKGLTGLVKPVLAMTRAKMSHT